jgi:hypothetical protein
VTAYATRKKGIERLRFVLTREFEKNS